jgi:hypothetical protein
MNHESEKTTMVPAAAGFYLVFPVIDDLGQVVEADLAPVIAWETGSNGLVEPVAWGPLAPAMDPHVLCPNGCVVGMGDSWESLAVWLSDQKARAARAARPQK